MKLLYISSKRAKELPILENIALLDFQNIALHSKLPKITYLKNIGRLVRTIVKNKPKAFMFESCGLYTLPALLYCWIFRVRYYARLKGNVWNESENLKDFSFVKRIYANANRIVFESALKKATAVLPISKFLKEVVEKRIKAKTQHVFNIPFNKKVYANAQNQIINNEPNKKIVLTVTNFNFWKKIEPLLDNFEDLYKAINDNDFEWRIIGGGTFLEKSKLSIPDQYRNVFLGAKDFPELMNAYRSAYCFLYVSGLDGQPNVLMEAGLFNLPIMINHDCPAIEFIKHEETGYVLNLDQQDIATQFQKAIRFIQEQPHVTDSFHEYVIEKFSISTISSQIKQDLDL